MVQGRIESLFFLLGTFDTNPGQFLIPFFARITDDLFKIPAGDFRIEILQGIGGTDIGNRNLDLNDFAGFGFVLGQETQVCSGCFPTTAESVIRVTVINDRLAVADNQGFIERPGIPSGIVQVPFLGPAVDNMKAVTVALSSIRTWDWAIFQRPPLRTWARSVIIEARRWPGR